MKDKLTLQALKDMPPKTIFDTGIMLDEESGLFMTGSGCWLRWVACRGGYHDWAIYCHHSYHDKEWIQRHGDKVHDEKHIKMLVNCDEESFKMYRY